MGWRFLVHFRQPFATLVVMSPVAEELVRDLVDLKVAGRSSRGKPAERLRRVEGRVRRRVGDGVSKAVAARVLGVSVPTVDKWIARGRIPTVPSASGPQRVAVVTLVDIAALVEVLREQGQTDGLVAAAILRLEQEDPAYHRDVAELYGDSISAIKRRDLIPATIPANFGPDD
jgi:transposase